METGRFRAETTLTDIAITPIQLFTEIADTPIQSLTDIDDTPIQSLSGSRYTLRHSRYPDKFARDFSQIHPTPRYISHRRCPDTISFLFLPRAVGELMTRGLTEEVSTHIGMASTPPIPHSTHPTEPPAGLPLSLKKSKITSFSFYSD